jgi:Xaa-Pro aminopeptidase
MAPRPPTAPNYAQRRERLLKLLKQLRYPAIMVASPTNVTYLTGFTGEASYLLLAPNICAIVSDSRFATQLAQECPDVEAVIKGDSGTTAQTVADFGNRQNWSGLAVESAVLSQAAFDDFASRLQCPLIATQGLVEQLRAIKDAGELATIRRAIQINERAWEAVRAQLTGEQTERSVGHLLEHHMRQLGAEGCAFPAIVGVGPRSALPHARLTTQTLESSSFVLVDWGTRWNGYVSDLTRMWFFGKVPDKILKIYDIVRRAQAAAIAQIRPGADCQVVDRAARQTIADAGYAKYFGHGLGHGIGMQVHESPYFSPSRVGVLAAGMIVTVEPGIYLPGIGGVRLEDDVLVTPHGAEVLSQLPLDPDAARVRLW